MPEVFFGHGTQKDIAPELSRPFTKQANVDQYITSKKNVFPSSEYLFYVTNEGIASFTSFVDPCVALNEIPKN